MPIKTDEVTIPAPGELFAALSKQGKPNWAEQYRGPIPVTYSNRAQIALNLGGLIADGFIAVEAQDSQQVKNIGTDIIKLAKALSVSENVLSRGKSINEFAENGEWDALQEELEATQNEVKTSMQSNSDQDFVILVSLGGWIRGTQVVSGLVLQDYNEANAKVLRQPALVAFIQNKVDAISPALREEAAGQDGERPAFRNREAGRLRAGWHSDPGGSAQAARRRHEVERRNSEQVREQA